MSWLSYLLSRELPLECTLRLWDTYFSGSDGFDLHIYVCIGTQLDLSHMNLRHLLAILVNCSESLVELEVSELKSFLQRLPYMDMDEVRSFSIFSR